MKKIFIACLMVAFTFANAEARSFGGGRHHHNNRPNHYRPHYNTVYKKSSKGEAIALGVVTGLIGIAAINQIANGSRASSSVQYVPVQTSPTYIAPSPTYVTQVNNGQNCITTYEYGTTTTTCTSSPKVREIIYVR